ncbi:hypothetical protein DITRI_Ditri12bG0065100 [Diplodiscus trichospermus]
MFNGYFSKMPWLAIPYSDSETRSRVDELFKVTGVPHLVLLDESGKVSTDEGVSIILKYGEKGYPFTHEQIQDLEEKARTEQSIDPIIKVISDGNKLLVSKHHGNVPSRLRIPILNKWSGRVIFESDEEVEAQTLELILTTGALDFVVGKDEAKEASMLIAIGPSGKTVRKEAKNLIMAHGADAYPFTDELLKEIRAQYEEMAKCAPEERKEAKAGENEEGNPKEGWVCDGTVCTRV